jgi:hypothetical protein
LYPGNSSIYKVTISSGVSRYAYYFDEYHNLDVNYTNTNHFFKWDSKIILSLLPNDRQEQLDNSIILRSVYIDKEIPYAYYYKKSTLKKFFYQAEYKSENKNPLNQSLTRFYVQWNDEHISTSLELKKFINYSKQNKGLQLRFFGGWLSYDNESITDYRMSLNGRDGNGDYLFDEVFLGRTETTKFISKQFVDDYAGFKSPTSYFRLAEVYMFGFNATTTLPGILPLRLFLNIATFDNINNLPEYSKLSWELGIDLPIIKDIFTIYFPIVYSSDIKDAMEKQNFSTTERIRFELHLNKLNPLRLIKTIND